MDEGWQNGLEDMSQSTQMDTGQPGHSYLRTTKALLSTSSGAASPVPHSSRGRLAAPPVQPPRRAAAPRRAGLIALPGRLASPRLPRLALSPHLASSPGRLLA